MSLNKFTNTSTGFDLDLDIGCDELKANNITTDNIDANTINGGPIGGGVTNPLTADLKLGGFAIIEPLTAVSPALNIDQLDPAKKIDLKVGGVAKVVVKNGEVEVKENLKMNQKQIDDVLVVNNSSGPLNLIGGSGVSAVLIDATPTQGIIIGSDVGKSTEITGDTEISLISNTGNIELNPASQMNVNVGGPRLTVDAIEVGVDAKLNMNNNSILNINTSNTQQTQTELIVKPTVGQLPITATNGVLVTENNLPGGEIFESNSTENKSYKDLNMNNNSILNASGVNTLFLTSTNQIETSLLVGNGAGPLSITSNNLTLTETNIPGDEYMTLDPTENKSFKSLNMNNNNINNANKVISSGTLSLESSGGGGQIIEMDGTFITFLNNTINPSITPSGLDLNSGLLSNCISINGLTPVGGLYAGTSAGTLINTTAVTSLEPTSSVGSLTIPANGFQVGDSFHLVVAGDCSLVNNDTVQITLRQNGNVLAQSTIFAVENANTGNNVFEIEADFTIRSIGATGSVHTSGEFTYNKDSVDSKDFRGIRFNDTQTIDTTATATLVVEFQFVSRPGGSTLQTQLFRLNKVY